MLYTNLLSSTLKSNKSLPYTRYWFFTNDVPSSRYFFYTHRPVWQSPLLNLNLSNSANTYHIYFLRKEVYYTKLKYSRVPQFDTSAGAVASFLSGMYGFMVSEKFGFELIDSGDFLFLVLYVAFLTLMLSTLTTVFNATSNLPHTLRSAIRSFF